MRRRPKVVTFGKSAILGPDTKRQKKIEMQIAKKNYEVECLKIELKYPDSIKDTEKIGFRLPE